MELTPQSRFEEQLSWAEVLGESEPVDYFRSGHGVTWLLAISQGIQHLQQHCLACDGALLRYR